MPTSAVAARPAARSDLLVPRLVCESIVPLLGLARRIPHPARSSDASDRLEARLRAWAREEGEGWVRTPMNRIEFRPARIQGGDSAMAIRDWFKRRRPAQE